MNRYLKIFILSIIFYLIYLFVTLQLIPFISLFTDTTIQSIHLAVGPIPIGYPLMLGLAIISNLGFNHYRRSRHDK